MDDVAVDVDVVLIEMDRVVVLENKSAVENSSLCVIFDSDDDGALVARS